MKRYLLFILLFSTFLAYTDIIMLKEVNIETGENIVLEGKIKKRNGEYILTEKDGTVKNFKLEDVIKKFNNERSYNKYLEERDNSMETLQKLEEEASELRSILNNLTEDKFIKVRYTDKDGYEFYQFEKKLNSKREMINALKDYRVAMKDYEGLYKTYRDFTNVATIGVALSVISGISGAVFGIYALSSNNVEVPSNFNLSLSNEAMIYGGAISGGVFLTGAVITGVGIGGRLHTRVQFVKPVEKYNQWLENRNRTGSIDSPELRLEFSFNF